MKKAAKSKSKGKWRAIVVWPRTDQEGERIRIRRLAKIPWGQSSFDITVGWRFEREGHCSLSSY
jgi:hypothetical protein